MKTTLQTVEEVLQSLPDVRRSYSHAFKEGHSVNDLPISLRRKKLYRMQFRYITHARESGFPYLTHPLSAAYLFQVLATLSGVSDEEQEQTIEEIDMHDFVDVGLLQRHRITSRPAYDTEAFFAERRNAGLAFRDVIDSSPHYANPETDYFNDPSKRPERKIAPLLLNRWQPRTRQWGIMFDKTDNATDLDFTARYESKNIRIALRHRGWFDALASFTLNTFRDTMGDVGDLVAMALHVNRQKYINSPGFRESREKFYYDLTQAVKNEERIITEGRLFLGQFTPTPVRAHYELPALRPRISV